ncbi:MAG: HyaD/HybD family hydrogenase maturation endopeptidase [Acidobacteriota bacterium]
MSAAGGARLLVLGLGNVLCGDDGAGVEAVRRLLERYDPPDSVRVVDGGTLGLSLMGLFEPGDEVLLVDAIRAEAPFGTLIRLEADDVAPAMRERLSVHQVGVVDLLDALRLLNCLPAQLTLLGLVPKTLELGLSRSAEVEANLPHLVEAVAEEIRRAGHVLQIRSADDVERQERDGYRVARVVGL